MKRFIEKMIHFKLIDYMNVIENEICIPFYICFLQIDKSAVDDDNLNRQLGSVAKVVEMISSI